MRALPCISQISSAPPDLKHTITSKPLCVPGCYSPPRAREAVRRRGLTLKDGTSFVQKARLITGIHHTAPEAEDQEGLLTGTNLKSWKSRGYSDVLLSLKACVKHRDLSNASRIHADILKQGLLEKNTQIGSALISTYTKCSALAQAQQTFDELPVQDVITWNALITGYAKQGHCEEALIRFEQMPHEGLFPDSVTFAWILKACGSIGAIGKGKRIHSKIIGEGLLEENVVLGSALVDMYVKFGALQKAQEVLDELPNRNVVTWTALMAGYAQQGHGEEALNCFEGMLNEGFSPDAITFTCLLKACGSIGAAEKGSKIHAEVARQGLLQKNIMLGSALIDMYARSGQVTKAAEVLAELPTRNVVTWNGLIAGYTQHGHGKEALNCLEQMRREGVSPDSVTFACVLKACGSIGAVEKGMEIHAEVVRDGFLENNTVLGSALVDMYSKCDALPKAQEVFNELSTRSVVTWTALIAGYAQHGHGEEALNCFEQMQFEGLSPNAVTFASVLKACACIGAASKGTQTHAQIVGLLEKDNVLGSALVDMYAKCGALPKAQQVFDELPVRDVVTWNVLITGYAHHRHGEEALNCFKRMQWEGLSPDTVTLTCVIKACGNIGAAEKGDEIYREIARKGFLENDIVLGSALVDMYVKCGALKKAQEVFDELPNRNIVTWNALITGFAQQGHCEKALSCFEWMRCEGLSPDAITFACVLNACGSIGATEKGKEIHAEIVQAKLLEKDAVLGNSLVDMYAKCGALKRAQRVFDELPNRNVVTWNALMAGYAHHGHSEEALRLFERMRHEGLSPDAVTFTIVLNACCNSGLVDECQSHFETMSTFYGVTPTCEHYTCMVDLFGRAGHFDKALAVIKKMPSAHLSVWCALLGACEKWGNVKLGRVAFEHVVQLDEKSTAAYICMSNIYAGAGMQEDADKIKVMVAA